MEQKSNLEMDLYRSISICNKCNDFEYAQALYAALCNNDWVKKDVMQMLKDSYWYCSWRYAGGIVSKMRDVGDYMDFYCTGTSNGFINEGEIIDEIRRDLSEIGWVPR